MYIGLLGRKLGHSYSPQIHSYFGDYDYLLREKEPEDVSDFLQNDPFSGLNITIPYKKQVIPHCAELTIQAKSLGAVNTIVRRDDGKLIGHNTDYFGFTSLLEHSGLSVKGKKVLVLGSGGAAVTAVAVLQAYNANVVVISRSGENNYNNLHLHYDASVIVNATPVGMYPNNGTAPVDISSFPYLEGVLDMIYNPASTKLLMDAQARGIVAENGLWMLIAQAKESAQWFTGKTIPDSIIPYIHNKLQKQMKNIVLIGMPGSGKSTIGKQLSQMLDKPFVDSDAVIAEQVAKPIPDIITNDGEEAFRKLETTVLSQLGKQSGMIIATGGGCVTRPENYPLLHQNSTVVWLKRDIDKLPTDGRPLSQQNKLEQMYAIREPLYRHFADAIIDNNRSLEETLTQIRNLEMII